MEKERKEVSNLLLRLQGIMLIQSKRYIESDHSADEWYPGCSIRNSSSIPSISHHVFQQKLPKQAEKIIDNLIKKHNLEMALNTINKKMKKIKKDIEDIDKNIFQTTEKLMVTIGNDEENSEL